MARVVSSRQVVWASDDSSIIHFYLTDWLNTTEWRSVRWQFEILSASNPNLQVRPIYQFSNDKVNFGADANFANGATWEDAAGWHFAPNFIEISGDLVASRAFVRFGVAVKVVTTVALSYARGRIAADGRS